MRRGRPIFAVLSALLIAAAGIACCCMRMELAAADAQASQGIHSCCQTSDPAPSSPKECDRCDFAGMGGLVSLQPGKAITVDPPLLVATVPPVIDVQFPATVLSVGQSEPRPPWLDVTPLTLRTQLTL